ALRPGRELACRRSNSLRQTGRPASLSKATPTRRPSKRTTNAPEATTTKPAPADAGSSPGTTRSPLAKPARSARPHQAASALRFRLGLERSEPLEAAPQDREPCPPN